MHRSYFWYQPRTSTFEDHCRPIGPAACFAAIIGLATFTMNSRVKFFVVFASTSLAALLLVGAVIGKSASPDGPYRHLAVYTEVLSRIKSEYVEEPDMKSVTLGALNGLLESIDPFASYLNADQYKEYLKKKDAKRADVGLLLSKRGGYLMVVGAAPGSPAAKAGMSSWDMIET